MQDREAPHKHIDGTLHHDDCLSFLPAPSSIFTPILAVERTTTSITTSESTAVTSSAPARREITRSPPVFSLSPALEQTSSHIKNEVAIQSPTTLQIDTQPLIPENTLLHGRQSPRDNVTEVVDAAARNLRRTPPASTFTMQLRPSTSAQGRTQRQVTSYLPDIITD